MSIIVNKEVHIKNYINGTPKVSDFIVIEKPIPTLKQNQILVKNLWMSVDPYMRGRMTSKKSYIAPFELNSVLQGGAIGIVESSKNPYYSEGDIVSSFNGWREYFIAEENELQKIETSDENLQHYLGVLGMPGLTAYSGLLEIGKPKAGDTVFVSAATGAVGSLVCQIAKLKGCKVIASAGSDEKIEYLKNKIGVDFAFNYKTSENINLTLQKNVPQGIDIYFDNVGGDHLQAAINNMNTYGRIVMCGMISQYNLDKPEEGPNNLMQIIGKRLLIKGFIVSDFESIKEEFYKNMSDWIKDSKIIPKESVLNGIENSPIAFINLFEGNNFGKMLVKL